MEAAAIVPVTVITGYLGAGKTTVIRSLLRALPDGYTCAWLKNEYGDAAVDSAVASDARIAVREVTNGCLCCTKVGELQDALLALHEMRPHRILVEASGSALPGPLVWEIEKLKAQLSVDGVVTVVDCVNFSRIQDFTRSARVQAQCTDLVLLNKVELAGEDRVEVVLDDLNELVPEVPKVRTIGESGAADPALVFGIDAHLWRAAANLAPADADAASHMHSDAECYHVHPSSVPAGWTTSRSRLEAMLKCAPADDLYRCKGVVRLAAAEAAANDGEAREGEPSEWWLFNGVAGRLTLEPLRSSEGPASLVFMGRDLARRTKAIAAALELPAGAVVDANAPGFAPAVNRGVARGLCVKCE
ncbi:hypothetical protein AB1Y20_009468 [Prymnesium parvum]|uniref:CobW/HypB/UreG nucleotide-binding domain-containing protein n=1 Tax=Prymnesium parvum TaxID=97485 RepID=A0AB34K491_PRYPA